MLVTILKFTAPHVLHSALTYVTESILHDPASSCLCRRLHTTYVLILMFQILKCGQCARSTCSSRSAGLPFLPKWHFPSSDPLSLPVFRGCSTSLSRFNLYAFSKKSSLIPWCSQGLLFLPSYLPFTLNYNNLFVPLHF